MAYTKSIFEVKLTNIFKGITLKSFRNHFITKYNRFEGLGIQKSNDL